MRCSFTILMATSSRSTRKPVSFGYSREELLQMSVADISPGFDLASARQRWDALKSGKPYRIVATHRHKNGSSFPVEARFASLTIDTTFW